MFNDIVLILNSEDAVKKALKFPNCIFGFESDWNGEKYDKVYKFNYETFEFEEIK